MSGIWDGVSSVWIVEHDRGLRVNGHRTRVDAIADLVRREMTRDHGDVVKATIRAAVELALSHGNDDEEVGLDDASPDDSIDAEYLAGLSQVYHSKQDNHGFHCSCDACTAFRVITVQEARRRAARETTGKMAPKTSHGVHGETLAIADRITASKSSACRDPSGED